MPRQTLVGRVERLEAQVTVLEQLPERVEKLASQISHLQQEMRDEFSAMGKEISAGDEWVVNTLRGEMRNEFAAVRREMKQMGDDLREDLGGQMRILHEDIIERFKLLQEARSDREPPDSRT